MSQSLHSKRVNYTLTLTERPYRILKARNVTYEFNVQKNITTKRYDYFLDLPFPVHDIRNHLHGVQIQFLEIWWRLSGQHVLQMPILKMTTQQNIRGVFINSVKRQRAAGTVLKIVIGQIIMRMQHGCSGSASAATSNGCFIIDANELANKIQNFFTVIFKWWEIKACYLLYKLTCNDD